MLNIGDCFTLHSSGKPHLHIVIQDQRPGDNNCQVICVYLSSVGKKRMIDDRTILNAGQHSFIKEKSFIKYRNVLVESKSNIETRIKEPFEQINPIILKDIQSQFLEPNPYSNIPKGIISLFNQWDMDNIFDHPDF